MYTSVTELGRGGIGCVDVVLRQDSGRLFARKRLRAELRGDSRLRELFLDELRVAQLVRSPHVVAVVETGEGEHGPHMVMELVDGYPLGVLIKAVRSGPTRMPLGVALRIVADAARGLEAIHRATDGRGRSLGIVHRDLTPSNLLIGFDGRTRVADLGVAKSTLQAAKTRTGVLKGKLGYMAPEYLRSGTVDARSDLFSLGVCLYESLSGERLYDPDGARVRRAIMVDPAPDLGEVRADAPDALIELCFELLAKAPEHRPASAATVADRLDEIGRSLGDGPTVESVMARHLGEARAARDRMLDARLSAIRRARGRAWVWLAAGVALSVLLGGLALLLR